ncbi:hypothetical protein, partial [Actinomadura sp. 3N508]|uniref:hypothetical protein n=1 Tax=Actinomadura sp. 3N508 TaxID=3375153 RepID=UPI00379FCAFE
AGPPGGTSGRAWRDWSRHAYRAFPLAGYECGWFHAAPPTGGIGWAGPPGGTSGRGWRDWSRHV